MERTEKIHTREIKEGTQEDKNEDLFNAFEKAVDEAMRAPIMGEEKGEMVQEITEELVQMDIEGNELFNIKEIKMSKSDIHHRDCSQPIGIKTDSEETDTAGESQEDLLTPGQRENDMKGKINTEQSQEIDIMELSAVEGLFEETSDESKKGQVRDRESTDEDSDKKLLSSDVKKPKKG